MIPVAKWYILGVAVSVAISLIGICLIIWRTTPDAASQLLKTLFFSALFVFTWGVGTLADFIVTTRTLTRQPLKDKILESAFYPSFFRGLIFSIVVAAVILIKKIL